MRYHHQLGLSEVVIRTECSAVMPPLQVENNCISRNSRRYARVAHKRPKREADRETTIPFDKAWLLDKLRALGLISYNNTTSQREEISKKSEKAATDMEKQNTKHEHNRPKAAGVNAVWPQNTRRSV